VCEGALSPANLSKMEFKMATFAARAPALPCALAAVNVTFLFATILLSFLVFFILPPVFFW